MVFFKIFQFLYKILCKTDNFILLLFIVLAFGISLIIYVSSFILKIPFDFLMKIVNLLIQVFTGEIHHTRLINKIMKQKLKK